MRTDSVRDALFISHANPEDNAFTLWLGAKLTALGYEVFADILRLRGGNDWERILENAIRQKAAKFFLVATPIGVKKRGVRNEITIASQTAKTLGDENFIVPLRLARYETPLQIAHAQYIDFSEGWAHGLNELLDLLGEVPREPARANSNLWQSLQLVDARQVIVRPERLSSNWIAIDGVPDEIFFYDFKPGISIGKAQSAIRESSVPVVGLYRGILSFAPRYQLQEYFGPNLPLECVAQRSTDDFLNEGWSDLRISPNDARAKFTDLTRRGFDRFFEASSLQPFEFSSGRLGWWPTASEAGLKRLTFNWPEGPSGSRQIVGRSIKRGFHWHYGVTCWARTAPVRHVRVTGRVVFTSDGTAPIGDAKRLHRLRRSFCRNWRNDKWRDLLLAFWFWLGKGADSIQVPLGHGVYLGLKLPPMVFDSPFSPDVSDDSRETSDDGETTWSDDVGDEGADDEPDELDDDEHP